MKKLLAGLLLLSGCATEYQAHVAESIRKEGAMKLSLRSRAPAGEPQTRTVEWNGPETAFIVCDMWDDHWCKGAAARVGELAPRMNELLQAARGKGALIIHGPSSTVAFYKDTPARKRAQEAAYSKPASPLSTSDRWDTKWCWPDKSREPDLPIDDSDMGCDCAVKCKIEPPWKRQIAAIYIDQSQDAITDDGQETINLLDQRKIKHVVLLGVHLNMCVLGRPFAIRQMVQQGREVALVRDMTDTMYNSKMRPQVNHFAGTDLVIEHVEKYWCPTLTSDQIRGGKPFKFKEDARP